MRAHPQKARKQRVSARKRSQTLSLHQCPRKHPRVQFEGLVWTAGPAPCPRGAELSQRRGRCFPAVAERRGCCGCGRGGSDVRVAVTVSRVHPRMGAGLEKGVLAVRGPVHLGFAHCPVQKAATTVSDAREAATAQRTRIRVAGTCVEVILSPV
ncbi:hypothetical protein CB1_000812015 [Camelus ferus]|nr:hypothetical protein CB1_000812015 [Camelus ferus]